MYTYTIGLIESLLEQIYLISIAATGSVFLSLFLLALVVRLLTQPLARFTDPMVKSQASLDQVLTQQIHLIKQQFKGEARHRAIQRLYGRFSYSPLLAVRALAGLAIQLPFFIAAYYMLDTTGVLTDLSLPLIGDLDRQDKVLFGEANLLPLLLLATNMAAVRLALDQNPRRRRQGIVIAILFFVFLYDKKAGLVLYWTLTNALTLLGVLYRRYGANYARVLLTRFPTLGATPGLSSQSPKALTLYFVGATLALSWPLIDLMSRNETFFLAHSFPQRSILLFLLVVTLVPTLALFLVRALVNLRFHWLVPKLDSIILFSFFLLFSLYLINTSLLGLTGLDDESVLYLILSTLLAFVLLRVVRSLDLHRLVPWVCLLGLLPALNFIYRAPSSALFSTTSFSLPYADIDIPDTPIFIIIFDEFSGLTLQTPDRQLNTTRYPGFAELAEQADYFPNSITPRRNTINAVPGIASGTLYGSSLKRDHNILDMLRYVTDVNVESKVLPSDLTRATFNSLKANRQDPFRIGLVMDDLLTIYIYAVGHLEWTQRVLGDFPQVWAGIGKLNLFAEQERLNHASARHPKLQPYESWLADVKSGQPLEQLSFRHVMFPHVPYLVTATGQPVQNDRLIRDALSASEREKFDTFDAHTNVLQHNYLQQVQSADILISELIEALRIRGIYDQSLIFITADHGVSYSLEGLSRRHPVHERSWINIMSVPLFVKYPHQIQGRTINSMATTLDIAPTLLSVLGIEAPWEMQGETLENWSLRRSTSRSIVHVTDFDVYGSKFNDLALESINWSASLFTEAGPIADIRVNYTGNPAYDSLLGKTVRDDQVTASNLTFSPRDKVFRGEITFAGILKDSTGEAIDDVVLAISQNGEIVALTMSGHARKRHGYVPFSLPELEPIDAPRELKMFEVTRNEDGTFTLGFVAELDS